MRSFLALFLVACGGSIGPEIPGLSGQCDMPSVTIRQIAGLYTAPNPFSEVPEGGLAIADEVTARAPGILEPRRGMAHSVQFNADRCFPLPGTSKVLTTSRKNAQPTVYDPDAGTTTVLLGSPVIPITYPYASDARVAVQAIQQQQNLYFTTAHGIVVAAGLSSYASNAQQTARPAGLLRPPSPILLLGGPATADSVMSPNSRRTYRVTLAMYDVMGNFLESSPSEPVYVENNNGSAFSISVHPRMLAGLGLNFPVSVNPPYSAPLLLMRVWRALETPLGVPSNDEMFLVNTLVISNTSGFFSGVISLNGNGFVDSSPGWSFGAPAFNDVSVDSLLTVPLYTNPQTGDGFGVASSNDPPPAAGAIATFKGRTLYGRPTFRQTLTLQIIGTGTTTGTGVLDGDTLTIDGITYTARSGTVHLPLNEFFIPTVGGQVAQNIAGAARFLVDAINRAYNAPAGASTSGSGYSRPEIYKLKARYLSNDVNDFGRIEISRLFPATLAEDPNVAFTALTPSLGFSFPNGTQNSTDNYTPGGLSWSKPNQPEAVPPVNFAAIGDGNAALLGFSVHRDAVIIYKEDGAWLYRDDGGPQPTIELLDASVIALAPNTIGVVNNLAYVWAARDLLQVSEQGTLPVSEPIRSELIKLLNLSTNHQALAYGVAYESERLYVLGIPASANELGCSYQYVLRVPDPGYPPAPPRWTRWLLPGTTSGCVLPNQNKLLFTYESLAVGNNVLAVPTAGIRQERKGGVVSTDFYDYGGSVACPMNTTTNVLIFPSDVHQEIRRGDVFTYNPAGAGTKIYTMRVLAVTGAQVQVDANYPFAGGTLQYFRSIQSRWRFLPLTGGEPTMEKQWNSVQAFFTYFDADRMDIRLDSESTPLTDYSEVFADPRNDTQGGQIQDAFPMTVQTAPVPAAAIGKIQWLRNCYDVLMRLDPAGSEARSARLGIEMLFAQAQTSFRLASIAAFIGESNVVGQR